MQIETIALTPEEILKLQDRLKRIYRRRVIISVLCVAGMFTGPYMPRRIPRSHVSYGWEAYLVTTLAFATILLIFLTQTAKYVRLIKRDMEAGVKKRVVTDDWKWFYNSANNTLVFQNNEGQEEKINLYSRGRNLKKGIVAVEYLELSKVVLSVANSE